MEKSSSNFHFSRKLLGQVISGCGQTGRLKLPQRVEFNQEEQVDITRGSLGKENACRKSIRKYLKVTKCKSSQQHTGYVVYTIFNINR